MEFDSRQTRNLRSILIKKIVDIESYYCSACKNKENSSDFSSAVHTPINENEKNETADLSNNPDLFTKMQQILSPLDDFKCSINSFFICLFFYFNF